MVGRKRRSCANCGHVMNHGEEFACVCGCRSYRERKSRAILEIQISDWEYEHNISMLRGLIQFDTIKRSVSVRCEPFGVITLGPENPTGKGVLTVRDIKAEKKGKKALKRLAKRKAKRESEKRKRSTADGRLMNPSAHRSQLRK